MCQHGTCPVCRKDLTGEDTSQREYIQPPPGTADVESAMDAGVSPDGGDRPANSTLTSSNSNSETTNNTQQASGSRSTNDPEVYNDMDFDQAYVCLVVTKIFFL